MADAPAARRAPRLRSQVRTAVIIATVVAVLASAFGAVSVRRLLDARNDLVAVISVAQLDSARLLAALVDQETGVRGYVLTGDPRFLEPYTSAREQQTTLIAEIRDR